MNPTRNSILSPNRLLTNIAISYMMSTDKFIAGKIFPTVPVDYQSAKYKKYNKGDLFRIMAKVRAEGSESAGAGFKIEEDGYFCEEIGLHKDLGYKTIRNAGDRFDLEEKTTQFLMQQQLIKRDYDFVQNYLGTGIWTGSSSGGDITPTTLWDDPASTPIEDVDVERNSIRRNTGYEPNVLALAPDVAQVLKNHPDVIDRIKYTQSGIVTTDILASLFGVDEVVVGKVPYNAAKEGAAADMKDMFSKQALLAYRTDTPSTEVPSAGYIFNWTGIDPDASENAQGIIMTDFEIRKQRAVRYESGYARDMKISASDLGAFFTGVIS